MGDRPGVCAWPISARVLVGCPLLPAWPPPAEGWGEPPVHGGSGAGWRRWWAVGPPQCPWVLLGVSDVGKQQCPLELEEGEDAALRTSMLVTKSLFLCLKNHSLRGRLSPC